MSGIDTSREGIRNRSFSESDSDKISELTFNPGSINHLNPGIGTEDEIPVFQSNPNLSSLNDEYIESPLWSGRGTRLQRRQLPIINDKYEKALKDCNQLIKDIDRWFIVISEEDNSDPDSIYNGIEVFKRRIARSSQEGLIRLVDKTILDQLASRQIKIETLRKRIDKEERCRLNQDLNEPLEPPPINLQEHFNPSRDSTSSENPLILETNPTPVEPEPEKNPSIEISYPPHACDIDVTINSDSDPPADTITTAHPNLYNEIHAALGSDLQTLVNKEKAEIAKRFDALESEQNSLRLEQRECRIKLDSTIENLGRIEREHRIMSSKIGSVESRVELIDRNLKSYVDVRIKNVTKNIEECKITQDKKEIKEYNSSNIKNALDNSIPVNDMKGIVDELETIKHKSLCDNVLLENMRSVVSEVKDQLDKSLDRSINSVSPNHNISIINSQRKERETDLTKNSIEGTARLIRQLTLVKVSEFSDVG